MTDVNRIEISADGQDLTITIGEYSNADARLAISVNDAGGDGSLAYNNTTGVITYTGPSASEVRSHFSAGTNITITNGQISSTDTNTTYDLSAVDGADNKKIIRLTSSDETDSDVVLVPGTNITLSRTDNEITINSTGGGGSGDRLVAGEAELVLNDDSTVSFPNNVIDAGANTIDLKSSAYAELWYHNSGTPEAGDGTETYIWAEQNNAGIVVGSVDHGYKEWYFRANGTTRYPTLTVPVSDAGYGTATGQVLKFDTSDAGQAIIFGPSATSGAAERIAIQGAPGADGTYGEGGDVYLWAGRGGSEVDGTGGGNGGDIKIRGGQGRGTGGSAGGYVRIQGGDSENGAGGYVDIQGGDGTTNGYTRILTAGGTERIKVDDAGLRLNNAYTMPSADGGADQVLTAHADGTVTWEDAQAVNPFDQSLNTTDDPTFTDVYLTTSLYTPKVDAAINGTLVLQGDELVLNTVDVDNASQFLNLNSQGYTYDLPLNSFSVNSQFTVSNFGTTSATFNHYVIFADVTSGSNLLTNTTVLNLQGNQAIDLSTVTDLVGLPILDFDQGYFDLGVVIQSISNIQGTYDPDPGTNTQTATLTLTVKDSAIATTANCQMPTESQVPLDAVHYIRNSTATNVVFTGKDSVSGTWDLFGLYRDASNNGYQDGADIAVTYVSYDYTGTQDFQITPRRVLKLQPKNAINEHVNIPFGLGVGPGAISTDRGLERASNDTIGINIQNNGKLTGYANPTGITLTQFKNNSYFNSGVLAERCGPTFTFNSFAGNSDTPTNQLNLSNGDGIGQIKFYATNTSTNLVSFSSAPAGIVAKATEDHNSTTKQGVGLYLQYSPNSQTAAGRPKTFLRAENATTEVLAKTTLKLSKITTGTGSSTVQLSTAPALTWVTIDDTSAAFTVPVKFPVYTKVQAGAITGSVGMQICISDSAGGSNPNGMMAFWDTSNNRWSYVHSNAAL